MSEAIRVKRARVHSILSPGAVALSAAASRRMTSDIFAAYPGDDVVDIVGTHYYDNAAGPRQMTQAEFDRQAALPYAGGELGGLLTAFAFAAAHGKKLAVSEWAMWKTVKGAPPSDPLADDPVYVANMYDVFKTHAEQLAYENYYGCGDTHQLYPATLFPKGAATYRELWRAGQ